MEHVSLQSREEVEQELKPEMEKLQRQFGGEIPEEEQIKMQELLESKIAERIVQMTEEMVTEEQEAMQQEGEDPLIALKQQEINIKSGDLQRKTTMDQGRLGIDQARLDQTGEIAEARMDSQEDIAQLRANVNLNKQKTPKTVDVNKNVRFDN
jgi:hypothetical protein